MLIKLLTILFSTNLYAWNSSTYLEKFNTYRYWSTHLPPQYNNELVQFITKTGPLNQKLRDKWLIMLAEQKNWPLVAKYYKPSDSVTLQCFAAYANWQTHNSNLALKIAQQPWLSGHNQPQACNNLFTILTQIPELRTKRIKLALDADNIKLATYLLNHENPQTAAAFYKIHSRPEAITTIPHTKWHGEQVLYALKRMLLLNRTHASILQCYSVQKKWLNNQQLQRFYGFISLYTAMRNQPQTTFWFAKMQPNYYTAPVLEWQMRYALLHQNWRHVERLIMLMHKPLTAEQAYWLAIARMHLNKLDIAKTSLNKLSQERSYYGFLASIKLNKPLSFQHQAPCHNNLAPYTQLLAEIRSYYKANYLGKASQLLNDFMLELPKNQQCALVRWVSEDLSWQNQAIYMSNQPHLFNQLNIRFPTTYSTTVSYNAQKHHLSPEFVYSIIRQESAFNPAIFSPVGAQGLMQLMPRTAKIISAKHHLHYKDKQLLNPQKNVELGTQYLADLSKSLNHPLLVAAAYNAGPSAALQWVKKYPAPDIVTWIDTLPWKETRNYLKNIVAFNAIYQHRLHKRITLLPLLKPLPR